MIIDADGAVLGRLASRVAKKILSGEQVIIINAEKAVVSGDPEYVVKEYGAKRQRGDPYHGPFFPRYPDRIVWRTIRGMIPYKQGRGMDAMKRLKVYAGTPQNITGAEKITKTRSQLRCRYITLKEISRSLGANVG